MAERNFLVRIDGGAGLQPVLLITLGGNGKVFAEFLSRRRRLKGCLHNCRIPSMPIGGDALDLSGLGHAFDLNLKPALYSELTNGRAGFFSRTRNIRKAVKPTGEGDWEATDSGGIGTGKKGHSKALLRKIRAL
jgi:hypothetical protein